MSDPVTLPTATETNAKFLVTQLDVLQRQVRMAVEQFDRLVASEGPDALRKALPEGQTLEKLEKGYNALRAL
jgi:hypothetical protein